MRGKYLGWMLVAALLTAAAGATDDAPAVRGVYDLELSQLAAGVYLLQRPDYFRQPVEPNALVIINATDVVVVDAGGSARSAENAIRLIRTLTRNPVSVLVNTHWHGDHNLGNAVYRREFPGIRIAAHFNTQRAMTGPPMAYVQRYPTMLKEYGDSIEQQIATEDASGKLDVVRRARLERGLNDVREMAAEFGRAQVTPPDLLFDSEIALLRGDRTIHVQYLGKGNTEGDVVVWLPQERILASGDLVVAPIPYGFGSFPMQWLDTLDRLKAFDFVQLVPGHGPVLSDRAQIETLQAMLRSARAQAKAAVAAGVDLAKFKDTLDLKMFERGLVGDDKRQQALFKDWWTDPIARSAWLEAKGEPIVQGASDETG